MESEEIKVILEEARRACAEVQEGAGGMTMEGGPTLRQVQALARLIEVTEKLVYERETYAGRLRRTATARITSPPTEADNPAPPEAGSAVDATP